MKKIFIYITVLLFTTFLIAAGNCFSQNKTTDFENLKRQIDFQNSELQILKNNLNNETSQLKQKLNDYASSSLVLFLFGAFCALWAQNTGRNPWIWFFLGLIFSVITVIIILIKNAEDD
jgi:hypothetical protein